MAPRSSKWVRQKKKEYKPTHFGDLRTEFIKFIWTWYDVHMG